MKKLLLTLLLSLSIISPASYGEEINSFFGITLNDNAENYVSSNYIDSNKYKHNETIDGYFGLRITDQIKRKSPYVSYYIINIDNNNRIHKIYGAHDFINLEICQSVQKDLLSKLEEKYEIKSKYHETSYPEFIRYGNYFYTSSGNYFSLQCRRSHSKSSAKLQISVTTEVLMNAVHEYYNSGL